MAELEWEAGVVPAARRLGGSWRCYLCGAETAVLSFSGDFQADNGRLQMYCENTDCDAREVEVIVMRDNNPETAERADVQALRAVDRGPDAPKTRIVSMRDIGESAEAERVNVVVRRLGRTAVLHEEPGAAE